MLNTWNLKKDFIFDRACNIWHLYMNFNASIYMSFYYYRIHYFDFGGISIEKRKYKNYMNILNEFEICLQNQDF